MKRWLQTEYLELLKKKRTPLKLYVYLGRLQKRIDLELGMALWLALNHPNVFLGKSETRNEYGNLIHYKDRTKERLKIMLLIVKAVSKNVDVELVKLEEKNNG